MGVFASESEMLSLFLPFAETSAWSGIQDASRDGVLFFNQLGFSERSYLALGLHTE
jgi:hypothetical protein